MEGPRGGMFLRVKLAKLGWAHNKKLLLRYLVNEPELLSQSNCLNRRTPYLPPLIPTTGVFVYFVPANFVANQINHTGDGLSPWTVNRKFFCRKFEILSEQLEFLLKNFYYFQYQKKKNSVLFEIV